MSVEPTIEPRGQRERSLGRLVGGLLAKTALGLLVLIAIVPLGLVLLVANIAPLIAEWADRHD